jgi:hypothetical protein
MVEMVYGIAGSALLATAASVIHLFTRGSVVESKQTNLERWLSRIEAKLDRVIEDRQ